MTGHGSAAQMTGADVKLSQGWLLPNSFDINDGLSTGSSVVITGEYITTSSTQSWGKETPEVPDDPAPP